MTALLNRPVTDGEIRTCWRSLMILREWALGDEPPNEADVVEIERHFVILRELLGAFDNGPLARVLRAAQGPDGKHSLRVLQDAVCCVKGNGKRMKQAAVRRARHEKRNK